MLSTTKDGTGDASALNPATVKLFNELNCTTDWKQRIYHSNPNAWNNPKVQTVTCFKLPGNIWEKYALDKSYVLGSDLTNVQAQDTGTGQGWIVTVNVKIPASTRLGTLTTAMSSKYYDSTTGEATSPLDLLAVVLDGQLQGSPPQVARPVLDFVQITGGGTGAVSARARRPRWRTC